MNAYTAIRVAYVYVWVYVEDFTPTHAKHFFFSQAPSLFPIEFGLLWMSRYKITDPSHGLTRT